MDLPKAKALGSSLLLFTAVPWTICLLMYSGEFKARLEVICLVLQSVAYCSQHCVRRSAPDIPTRLQVWACQGRC